jgi:hypothetical protein
MRLCYEREQKTSSDFAVGTRGQQSGMMAIGEALAGFLSETLWFGVGDDFQTPSLKSAGQTFYAALRHA